MLAIANELSHKRINPVRILFLEDNFVQRQQLTEYLEKFEHDVLGLASAPEALEVLKTTYVDAVISDVYIRSGEEYVAMGGLWLLRSIRLKGRDRALLVPHDIPFLAISGGQEIKGGYSPLRSARDLGADFWLKKPVDEQELLLWLQDIEIEIAREKERS